MYNFSLVSLFFPRRRLRVVERVLNIIGDFFQLLLPNRLLYESEKAMHRSLVVSQISYVLKCLFLSCRVQNSQMQRCIAFVTKLIPKLNSNNNSAVVSMCEFVDIIMFDPFGRVGPLIDSVLTSQERCGKPLVKLYGGVHLLRLLCESCGHCRTYFLLPSFIHHLLCLVLQASIFDT